MTDDRHRETKGTDKHDSTPDGMDDDNKRRQGNRTSITEMVFSVFSVLLICTLCIYLVMQSMKEATPPAFVVEPGYPASRGDFVAVDVLLKNEGDQAAKALHVTGTMSSQQAEPVEAEATLDWLPGNSSRQITLIFPGDVVTTAKPEVILKGYEEP